MTAKSRATPASAAARPLKGLNVLIVDANDTTARLLRSQLEDRGAQNVEIAVTEDEALDVLGNAPRPVALAMMDTLTGGAACVDVLSVLVKHRARIAVTLHGKHAPEQYAAPGNLVGAAAYTHLGATAKAVGTAEEVLAADLTVHRILDDRIVPPTLDRQAAVAIYGAPPGAPFPLTLRP
jgi:CheY-like chemotaxis protein